MRVIFMGTPAFALPSLARMRARGDEIVAVVTQPDRPRGRGQSLSPSPVKAAALAAGLPVVQPEKVRHADFLAWCRTVSPDLIVVVAFGQILPQALLDIPRRGCLNVHASLLPRYRGAAPIQWAIIRGETETGVTTMQIDAGMDTGPMLLQRRLAIAPDETAGELAERLSHLGAEVLVDTLEALEAGRLQPIPQEGALATLAPLLKKDDGRIDWKQPAPVLAALVRGTDPWPGAYTLHRDRPLRIRRARAEAGAGEPGAIIRAEAGGIAVGTGAGLLIITEVQVSGGARLSAGDAVSGRLVLAGERVI
ncbi:MAG: methionyl-tRNA formyltransferase [Nitrospiria bacterium]